MNPVEIIDRYYQNNPKARDILISHSEKVAEKALKIARNVKPLHPDPAFIEQAAMLHDIGMCMTHAPGLGCRGEHPYVCHGILGRFLLERHDLQRHALVCERHVGTGISVSDIHLQNLPLPLRDMQPVSVEEQIICYADKFFSKNGNGKENGKEKTVDEIIEQLSRYGDDKVRRFAQWVDLFEA